jgi:MoaA/NifB/PqqE/SkfB family radical SAM enzyme
VSRLGVLWRGPLDSCNYDCAYCPFAKRKASKRVLDADRAALQRFVGWVGSASRWSLEVLLTPYGEALIWPWYREALVRMSHVPHVRRVAIQTNGSAPLDFLADADRERVRLWISWHPTEIPADRFAARARALHEAGIGFSVGAVAVPEHLSAVEALREALPAAVPMWINAQKPGVRYDAEATARWSALDPAFPLDARPHRTRGRPCATGEEVVSVDGDGVVRRCHFVDEVLGNLYEADLADMLRPRPCPRARCDCYIGYAHLPDLDLRAAYGDDLLARMRA